MQGATSKQHVQGPVQGLTWCGQHVQRVHMAVPGTWNSPHICKACRKRREQADARNQRAYEAAIGKATGS
jgi:hypothetical protein